jgi:hypothetical protein
LPRTLEQFGVPGDEKNRNIRALVPDSLSKSETIDRSHADVADDEVDTVQRTLREERLRRSESQNAVARRLEQAFERFENAMVVVNHCYDGGMRSHCQKNGQTWSTAQCPVGLPYEPSRVTIARPFSP